MILLDCSSRFTRNCILGAFGSTGGGLGGAGEGTYLLDTDIVGWVNYDYPLDVEGWEGYCWVAVRAA